MADYQGRNQIGSAKANTMEYITFTVNGQIINSSAAAAAEAAAAARGIPFKLSNRVVSNDCIIKSQAESKVNKGLQRWLAARSAQNEKLELAECGSTLTDEQWIQLGKRIEESQGFDIDDFAHARMAKFIPVYEFGHDSRPHELAKIALLKEFGVEYELVKVIRVHAKIVMGHIYYITFEARKTGNNGADDDGLTIFEAKVNDPLTPNKYEVNLCRIKTATHY